MMMMITALIAALVVIFILLKRRISNKGSNHPPGSFGWPLLGETIEFIRSRADGSQKKFVKERMEKYKSEVFKTSLMGEPVVLLSGAAANKFMFSNQNKSVAVWWPASMKKLLGECVITLAGAEGMVMRKMVSYFVSPDAFTKLYMQTINIVCLQHIETHWEGKEELKAYPVSKLYTFELACRLFMSMEDPEQIKKLNELFKVCLGGVFSVPLDLPGTRFYKAKRAMNTIKKELLVILRQRREALEQNTALPSQDLLSHLLVSPDENGKHMSESIIINNVLLLLTAGHDTSTSAIAMLIRALAQHPQVYDQVLREQNEISSSKKPGEFLQWEDIQKMKYSKNVVNETMRLWPSVASFAREALVDINYQGYHIPKGWKFFLDVSSTHTNSSLFPESTKFDPSRFDGTGPAPYSFVPFGGGPRMCLGKEFARLEILTFLHYVIRRFNWDLVIPDEKVKYDPIATPENGLPIRLHPRDI